ncbi:MAG TPA: hypothetical protein VEP49_19615, partial [Acidimicrobiia bacterium]|nr:hypothetical protein [Acidimicrobiia bacterium]
MPGRPSRRASNEPYEPPHVAERAPIALPLIGGPGASSGNFSAAFREPAPGYEAPAIRAREPVPSLLIGELTVSEPTDASAAFRPVTRAEPYAPPAIHRRESIGGPLVAAAASVPPAESAVFRPVTRPEPYAPPAVEARESIAVPLIGGLGASGRPPSAAFRPVST